MNTRKGYKKLKRMYECPLCGKKINERRYKELKLIFEECTTCGTPIEQFELVGTKEISKIRKKTDEKQRQR